MNIVTEYNKRNYYLSNENLKEGVYNRLLIIYNYN